MEKIGPGLSSAFARLSKLSPEEIQREEDEAEQELTKAERLILGFLDEGDLAEIKRSRIPYALGIVAIRMAPALRFHDVDRFKALLTQVTEMLQGREEEDQLMVSVSAHLLGELGNCTRIQGDLLGARPLILKALCLSKESVDPLSRGEVEMLAATYFEATGELGECERLARAALARFKGIGADTYQSRASYLLASIEWRKGDLEETVAQLTDLRERPLDSITRVAVTHLLTKCLVLQGQFFRVPMLLRELRSLLTDWEDNPVVIANTRWLLALYIGGTGSLQVAVTILAEVVEEFKALGQPREVALALVDQAFFELRLGENIRAARAAATALARSSPAGSGASVCSDRLCS